MYNLGLIGHFISKSQMPNLISKLGSEFDVPIKYQLFDSLIILILQYNWSTMKNFPC